MLQNFKQAILYKTFFGLKIQNIILEKLHKDYKKPTRLATKEEEAKNIDGFFGDIPIQIKPTTYKTKNALHENINIDIIYYEKKKNYIEFEIPDNLVQNSTQKKLF